MVIHIILSLKGSFGSVGASEGKYGVGTGILQSLDGRKKLSGMLHRPFYSEFSLLRESFRMCYKLAL